MKKIKRIFWLLFLGGIIMGGAYLMFVDIPAPTQRVEALLDTNVYIN